MAWQVLDGDIGGNLATKQRGHEITKEKKIYALACRAGHVFSTHWQASVQKKAER